MPKNNDILILRILYAIILLSAFLLYRNYTIEQNRYVEPTEPTYQNSAYYELEGEYYYD